MTCCETETDGAAAAGSAGFAARSFVIDMREQVARALASGAEDLVTTDGDVLTCTALIAAGDTATLGPTGLVWDEGTTNTSWDTTTRSATSLVAPLSSVFAILDTDTTWAYRIDAYFSQLSLLNAEYTIVGFDGVSGTPANAGSRLAGSGRARQAATQVWRPYGTQSGAAGVNYTTAPGGTLNVTSVLNFSQACSAHGGVWTGDWSTYRSAASWGLGNLTASILSPMQDQNTRLLLSAFASQGVAGTSSLTLEQIRVSAFGFAQA